MTWSLERHFPDRGHDGQSSGEGRRIMSWRLAVATSAIIVRARRTAKKSRWIKISNLNVPRG